jgi:hypothetical protein
MPDDARRKLDPPSSGLWARDVGHASIAAPSGVEAYAHHA